MENIEIIEFFCDATSHFSHPTFPYFSYTRNFLINNFNKYHYFCFFRTLAGWLHQSATSPKLQWRTLKTSQKDTRSWRSFKLNSRFVYLINKRFSHDIITLFIYFRLMMDFQFSWREEQWTRDSTPLPLSCVSLALDPSVNWSMTWLSQLRSNRFITTIHMLIVVLI